MEPPFLFDLYKIAVEEYRFEVKLNTDRMIHYLVFNAAVLSVGAGLLKAGGSPLTTGFVLLLFAAGIPTAVLGVRAVKKGHEYYRRAVYKKTLIEAMLGLHRPARESGSEELQRLGASLLYPGATLAIATTAGHAEVAQILGSPEVWIRRPLRAGTVVQAGVIALWLLLAADIVGLIATGVVLVGHAVI